MIIITPQAAEQIRKSTEEQSEHGASYLRLAARLDASATIEYGMGFDARAEGDLLVTSAGIEVLVSPGCSELLAGATLDYVEINPGEKRFIFMNPNDPSHKAPKAPG